MHVDMPPLSCSSNHVRHVEPSSSFFFFNDTATTEIYTLSLHDALPISYPGHTEMLADLTGAMEVGMMIVGGPLRIRSEEHTSELQSRLHLVCRLLLEKKNNELHGRPPSGIRSHNQCRHARTKCVRLNPP